MPADLSRVDPRTELARRKYFSMRPRVLERWLWHKQLPRAAERVFWFHWDAGQRNNTWCSQVPISRVADACCVNTATVTRAYQLLQKLGLIRRDSGGRDPACPFQQPVAITEVRIPRELLAEVARQPDRRVRHAGQGMEPALLVAKAAVETTDKPAPSVPASLREVRVLFDRLSPGERSRFQEASLSRCPRIEFDAGSKLGPAEQAYLLNSLARQCERAPEPKMHAYRGKVRPISVHRPLSPIDLARIGRRVTDQVKGPQAPVLAREVAWAVGEGALARFGPAHGLNIALKKIREGVWTRPHRMPPNALYSFGAALESCAAA